MDIRVSLGEWLKNYRNKTGYTQAQMARMCKISERYYRKIEAGNSNPSFLILVKFYRLGLDLNALADVSAGADTGNT